MSTPAIWWVRRDFRLTDNPALAAAVEVVGDAGVLPVFVLDEKLLASRWSGTVRQQFLFAGLRALDESLRARGSRLIVRAGNPLDALLRLREESGAREIVAERDFSPNATQRDLRVAASLPLSLVDGVTVRAPEEVRKGDGAPYTVFTPFSKRWKSLGRLTRSDILPATGHITTPTAVRSLGFPGGAPGASIAFAAGEGPAGRRLSAFVDGDAPIYRYAGDRNRPDLDGTSQLSPHLRFGMISTRSAALAAFEAIDRAPTELARQSAET